MVKPLLRPACFDPLTPAFAGCAVPVIDSPRFPLGAAGISSRCFRDGPQGALLNHRSRPLRPLVHDLSDHRQSGLGKWVVHPARSFPTTRRVVLGYPVGTAWGCAPWVSTRARWRSPGSTTEDCAGSTNESLA